MSKTLEKLALDARDILKQRGLKLVTAESCTGGGLSYWITSVPGSSDWFERGFVTYSNAAKKDLLEVNTLTLDTYGAVSEQTAKDMAEGALINSAGDIAIAITGIAGPDGGSTEKPVGTVWIAMARLGFATKTLGDVYPGDRVAIRTRSIERALELLKEWI